MRKLFAGLIMLAVAAGASAQYAATGISKDSSLFTGWATGVQSLVRGPQNIANPSGAKATFGAAGDALGKANNTVVSLGDGGSITLSFDKAIRNGAGADFAVFENGFKVGNLVYAELAYVEVSSNGSDFFRFPSISLTPTNTQIGGFAGLDSTKVHNLAGQFVTGEGTGFDLSDLLGVSPLLNINQVSHVRLIDVVGSINPAYARYDSQGRIINDPWSTPFASSGFDLDAVGVINAVPEPGTLVACALAAGTMLRRRRQK